MSSLDHTTIEGPDEATSPRRLLSRDERRAAIIDCAAAAFVRAGYTGTSMDDVARASGVTKLIIYRNFDSKEAVYRGVLEAVSGRLAEVFAGEIEAGRRPAGARALLTVAREDPDAFVLLWRHAVREPRFAAYAEEFRGAATAITRELIDDQVQTELLDWAAQTLVDWNVQAVLAWLTHGSPEGDEEFIERARRTVRAMLSAWAEF